MGQGNPTQAFQALTFRDISPSVAEKIKTLFSLDYTSGLAYREHLKVIKNECKTNEKFQFKLANRSRMPNRRDFNNFFTDYKRDKF